MQSRYQDESELGYKVLKQHHQPNFSRVTEKEAEDEEDSLEEKWQEMMQNQKTDNSSRHT